nr:5'-3' exoribonuclease 4-like isoform X2 [Populus alba]
MGIPAFYRWLTEKYPLITADVMEETPLLINGVSVPLDTSCPNPNGIEFDNLYLDMNGIIHPCFHPEGLPPPTTYEEVFAAVFKYIDRIFSIVRPRKLLFMAIDGVAPRAKMNQQRSRRFRAARDAADQALSIETDGGIVPESEEGNLEQVKKLDSNVITPGTEFMDLLSSALHYYIRLRMKEDLGWRGIKVILSDANVAGEGEHKIMSYIRLQRNLPGFDPNTRHCLYGLDADLIMLALASHEIHFSILREDLGNARTGGKSLKEKRRLMKRRKLNGDSEQVGKFAENIENYISGMKFQFLNVWILREYLAYDLTIPDTTLKLDVERVIDDFVFMCLFVGNDFLPHIPSLEISEGALNLLMTVYKKEFAQMGGYLTNSFEINLIRVEHFVQALGSHESAIFRRRNQMQKEREIRFQRISKHQQAFHSSKSLFDDGVSESCKSSVKLETAPLSQNRQNPRSMAIKESNHFSSNGTSAVVDKIKLGDEGWKERYYAEKFEAKSEEERDTIRRHAVFKYVEGICWVMRYYYEGVCSWQWFYPYHYAPFASDFYGCDQLEIHFTLGEPFKPFDQLMAVLPAASAHALPLFYRKLMIDASSPILDFYPTDFELDNNGKRFSWQAICKLPFIEESRLVSEITKVEHTLTDEERRRNRLGYDVLCVHVSHPLAVKVISLFECKDQSALPTANGKLKIDPKISGGMNGYIYISEKPEWPLGIFSPIDGMLMIASEQVISVFYEYPPFHAHIPRLPEGVILPNKSVTRCNILHVHHLWHEPAIPGSISSKRQIPKSISGPQLAELAHRLVSEYSSSKHLDFHRCAERGLPLDAARMGEMGTQVQPKKRKRGKRNKNCLDGRSKESQVGKGDFVPINNVKNMESSTLRQQGESCGGYGSAGVDEIKIEKSKKRKRSSKNKEGAEGAGIPDGVQKLERSIQEQRNSDHTSGGADGENDYKEEKSRKRKSRKRKKKGNQNDGDAVQNKNAEKLGCCNHHISKLQSCILQEQSGGDVHEGGDVALELKTDVESKKRRKIEADGVLINNVEKLESCFLMGQRGGDSNHTNADGLDATINPVPNNNHQELEDGALELKTELKSKKKRRRSKKRRKIEADGVLINNVEKLGISPMEQRGGDSKLTNADGLDPTRRPVPNKINQELEGSGPQEQIEHFDHSGANEVEIKPEVKSKRKKRRSKKKRQIELIVPPNDPPESGLPGKQGTFDSNHIGVGGLEMKTEV